MATPTFVRGLLAALFVLAVTTYSDARPEPGRIMNFIHKLDVTLPHPHEYIKLSPEVQAKIKKNFVKVKNCLAVQIKTIPGAVAKSAMVCLPSAPGGVGLYATCLAGKGLIDVAGATGNIITCANQGGPPPNKPAPPPPHKQPPPPPKKG